MMLSVDWNLKPYRFNEDQVKQVVPEKEGIYRLSNTEGVFYVGESDNLQRRLFEHLPGKEENTCIKEKLKYQVRFRFALLVDKKDRLCAESFMYHHYKKENECECNDKTTSEKPCEINLL